MKRINASFYVLILSALSVSLIISALLYKAYPLFTSKTLFLCQKFISNIMFEILRLLPNTLILTTGAVLIIGLLSLLVQLVKTHIFLKKLLVNKVNVSSKLAKILERLDLAGKVILVNDRNSFSFCCGIFSPFIMVSTNLVKSLTDKELEAVLLHEQSHLISRDPTKILMGKVFSSMFFFLPIFRELYKNIEALNELLADQWVISRQKNTTFLRSALKKILAAPQLNLATVSNISNLDYFEIRIHNLINPGIKHGFKFSLVSLLTTFLFVFISFLLLQTPVDAFHMDSTDKSAHCHSRTEQSTDYIPSRLYLPEKKCNNR